MKTAEDVIQILKDLPSEEQEKVAEYLSGLVQSEVDELSPELETELDRMDADMDRGINCTTLDEKNFLRHLESLKRPS